MENKLQPGLYQIWCTYDTGKGEGPNGEEVCLRHFGIREDGSGYLMGEDMKHHYRFTAGEGWEWVKSCMQESPKPQQTKYLGHWEG